MAVLVISSCIFPHTAELTQVFNGVALYSRTRKWGRIKANFFCI